MRNDNLFTFYGFYNFSAVIRATTLEQAIETFLESNVRRFEKEVVMHLRDTSYDYDFDTDFLEVEDVGDGEYELSNMVQLCFCALEKDVDRIVCVLPSFSNETSSISWQVETEDTFWEAA